MIMAWALVQGPFKARSVQSKVLLFTTSFIPCAVSCESKVRSKQCGNTKRVIKMKCSLQTPTFSRLQGVNTLDKMVNRSHAFHSTIATATSGYEEKACRIEPSQHCTIKAKRVIRHAKEEASRIGHNFVGTEMILLGLIGEGNNIAAEVFLNMGIELKDARLQVDLLVRQGSESISQEIPFTPRALRVFELSLEEARRTGHKCYIEPEHLLLGLLREGGCVVSRVLRNLGAYPNNIRRQVMRMVDEGSAKVAYEESLNNKTLILEDYGTNLTELVEEEEKQLHPVVGRQLQIEQVYRIIDRLTKNNACLVGEHGVGKTSIAIGAAREFSHKEVIALDMRLLGRGEFEEKLKNMIEEIRDMREFIVLYIDEVHTLFGTGVPAGALGAINILRQALARGQVQCIGATTPDEYRKHLENDPSFQRLFQPVNVLEPSVNETIKILTGIRKRFERHHDVRYTHEALVAAAQLSNEYISDRFLPGKAVYLIDDAGSRVRQKDDLETSMDYSDLLDDVKYTTPMNLLEKKRFRMEYFGAVPDQDLETPGMLHDQEIDYKVEILAIEERIQEMRTAGEEGPTVTKADIQDAISSLDFYL